MSFLGRVTQNLQSIINYVSNGSADNSVTGWVAYADAAGTQPVDGTGGSPNLILARSTLTPLRQGADFNLIKDAANRQGQGISYDFTVDRADLAKVLTVTFDYEVLSGTYATGDLAVYLIQDPTGTPVVIQPAGYQVQSVIVGTTAKQIATFQTSSSIRNYRLCLHVASTSASAYSIAFDKVSIGPQVVQYGAPVTDWQDFPSVAAGTLITATTTNPAYGTVANNKAQWRRVGADMEIRWDYRQTAITGASAGSGTYLFNLPAGYAIDTAKVTSSSTNDDSKSLGVFHYADSIRLGIGYVSAYSSTQLKMVMQYQQGSTAFATATITDAIGFAFTNSLQYSILARVPILGWSSSVQMSNDTDTRVIATGVRASSNVSMTANNPIIFQAVDFDRSSSYNSATGQFTVPVAGVYEMSATGYLPVAGNSNIRPYKNGSPTQGGYIVAFNGGAPVSGSYLVDCKAGDILTFVSDATTTLSAGSVGFFKRLSGPSAIAASETVAARYTNTAGTSVPTGGAGAGLVPVPFANRSYDSHGFFNGSTGVGTIPISGVYRISCSFYFTSQAWTSIGKAVAVRKNGVIAGYLAIYTPASASTIDLGLVGSTEVRFNAGDTFDLNLWHNEASARTIGTLAEINSITISRIGN